MSRVKTLVADYRWLIDALVEGISLSGDTLTLTGVGGRMPVAIGP